MKSRESSFEALLVTYHDEVPGRVPGGDLPVPLPGGEQRALGQHQQARHAPGVGRQREAAVVLALIKYSPSQEQNVDITSLDFIP